MARDLITTAIYYRKPTKDEIALGTKKSERIRIIIPVRDVFLGVDEICSAILKPTIKGSDGLRYYFECVNLAETL